MQALPFDCPSVELPNLIDFVANHVGCSHSAGAVVPLPEEFGVLDLTVVLTLHRALQRQSQGLPAGIFGAFFDARLEAKLETVSRPDHFWPTTADAIQDLCELVQSHPEGPPAALDVLRVAGEELEQIIRFEAALGKAVANG